MTQERMICEKGWYVTLDADGYPLDENGWHPVEEAPPKDWRPLCFMNDVYDINDSCTTEHPPFGCEPWCCRECIYRKKVDE